MAVFKPARHAALLKEVASGRLRAVLVYGSDPGGVSELSRRLVRGVVGDGDDPMSIVVLDEETCKEDPARLVDEAQAMSMFGGRRAIRVRGAGEHFARAMKSVLERPAGDAVIIAEAGQLKTSSGLRKLFEKEPALAAAPVYEDSARDIQQIIRETLEKEELRIAPDAMAALCELLGADRAASRGELEKLALYCMGRGEVTLEDVRAVCGDVSAHAMGDMLDAFFTGNAATGVRLFASLVAEGTPPAAILAAASAHVARLKPLALLVASGDTPGQVVVKAARPQIFFRRQPAWIRQLSIWSPAALERADEGLLEATAATRVNPALESEIAERCLLSLSIRAARTGRSA